MYTCSTILKIVGKNVFYTVHAKVRQQETRNKFVASGSQDSQREPAVAVEDQL
jgi:hypothetical protein